MEGSVVHRCIGICKAQKFVYGENNDTNELVFWEFLEPLRFIVSFSFPHSI
jgi:hypothetical protein